MSSSDIVSSLPPAPVANYDEALVGNHPLPDPLVGGDGQPVTTAEAWRRKRRPELLELFQRHVYGRILPKRPFEARLVESACDALEGRATRRQIEIRLAGAAQPVLHLALYLPNRSAGPHPCFLGLNFKGNHGSFADPAIVLSDAWFPDEAQGVVNHRATEAGRGTGTSRWPVEMIVERGYALATLYYGDIDPDWDDGFANGVHSLFTVEERHGDSGENSATIAAWAWGLSRVMDYLEGVPEIDAGRVCLTGHSRLGKTALWAGACDERFALVVANNSGCGGAALSRRNFGETPAVVTRNFPHWFCRNFRENAAKPETLPVDQHQLVSLIAPRPVFISSAAGDLWADPRGEFLGGFHAGPVYRLLGSEGMAAEEMPGLDAPVLSRIGYAIRPGHHDITPADWRVHLDFADAQLRRT